MKRIFAGSAACLVLISLCFVFAQEPDKKPKQAAELTAELLGVTDQDVLRRLEAAYIAGNNSRQLAEYRLAWEILLEMESKNISPEVDKRTPFQSATALEDYVLMSYYAAQQIGNGKIVVDMENIRLVRDMLKKREERKVDP